MSNLQRKIGEYTDKSNHRLANIEANAMNNFKKQISYGALDVKLSSLPNNM